MCASPYYTFYTFQAVGGSQQNTLTDFLDKQYAYTSSCQDWVILYLLAFIVGTLSLIPLTHSPTYSLTDWVFFSHKQYAYSSSCQDWVKVCLLASLVGTLSLVPFTHSPLHSLTHWVVFTYKQYAYTRSCQDWVILYLAFLVGTLSLIPLTYSPTYSLTSNSHTIHSLGILFS